jgi:hypothetical protein
MATAKQVAISVDERYPDFDIEEVDEYVSSYARLVEIDPVLFQEYHKVCNEYNRMQDILKGLYAKAGKTTKR